MNEDADKPALILVVEDNPANQMLIEAVLPGAGYSIAIVGSAPEALDSIGDRRLDLILMDIQLPGMDDLSLTRRLKADPGTASIRLWLSPLTRWQAITN